MPSPSPGASLATGETGMDLDLTGRVMAVTGATKGVGRAVVQKLVASGANVVFQGRDADAAAAMAASSGDAGPPPVFVAGDLYSRPDLDRLVGTAVDRFGRLDGVLGSGMSGGPGIKPFRAMEPDELMAYFESGVRSRVHLLHAAAAVMAEQHYGKVVLVTTDAGRVPTPGESMIGAAAASLVYLARTLGRELSRDGIRVNTLAITLTRDTPGYDRFAAKRDRAVEGTGERDIHVKAFDKLESRMPFGLGTAAEAADLACFLLAPVSDGITGATLSINRGAYFPTYA
jgi:3-oxoacyl-[acyl-carrier protein] reductase